MGFFSDLGKKTSETTGKIARETKLKFKINAIILNLNPLFLL